MKKYTIKAEVVAEQIRYLIIEGRISEKDADVICTRLVHDWGVENVPFDIGAFYTACGLDKNKPVIGEEYN